MNPAPNGSSAIHSFEGSDVIKIHNEITFDFYTGLPHMYNTQLPSMTSMWHGSGVLNKRIFSSSTQTSEYAIQLYKLMHFTNPYQEEAIGTTVDFSYL